MAQSTEEGARARMHELLATMARAGGSDLFIASDYPPSMKTHGAMTPLAPGKLTAEDTSQLANALMNAKQREEFARELECNFAIGVPGVSRFRVIVFVDQGAVGINRWVDAALAARPAACTDDGSPAAASASAIAAAASRSTLAVAL